MRCGCRLSETWTSCWWLMTLDIGRTAFILVCDSSTPTHSWPTLLRDDRPGKTISQSWTRLVCRRHRSQLDHGPKTVKRAPRPVEHGKQLIVVERVLILRIGVVRGDKSDFVRSLTQYANYWHLSTWVGIRL